MKIPCNVPFSGRTGRTATAPLPPLFSAILILSLPFFLSVPAKSQTGGGSQAVNPTATQPPPAPNGKEKGKEQGKESAKEVPVGEAVPNIPDISKSTLRESFMEIRALTAEMEKAQAQWQLANEHKQTAQQRLVTACTAAKSAAKLDPTRYDCLGSGDIQRLK